jgi:excinuclease ABC subunit A
MMQKPDVEHIDGLSPAISIEQKTTSRNPRSTVATCDGNLRLYAPAVGADRDAVFARHRPADRGADRLNMVDRVMVLPEGTRIYLLAPVIRARKGEYRRELAEWQKAGFTRVRVNGEMYPIEEAPCWTRSSSTTSRWWSTGWR